MNRPILQSVLEARNELTRHVGVFLCGIAHTRAKSSAGDALRQELPQD